MRKRIVSIAFSAVLLTAIVLAYLALPSGRRAQAQGADGLQVDGDTEPVIEPAAPNLTIEPGPAARDPFAPYPADEGALTWDDLTEAEQAGAEAMQEWAETANGETVHNAFAAAAATTSELQAIEAAQTASGLDGIETLGVVP